MNITTDFSLDPASQVSDLKGKILQISIISIIALAALAALVILGLMTFGVLPAVLGLGVMTVGFIAGASVIIALISGIGLAVILDKQAQRNKLIEHMDAGYNCDSEDGVNEESMNSTFKMKFISTPSNSSLLQND